MFKAVRETSKYRTTRLYESELFNVTFVQDKNDREYDRVMLVRYGNKYAKPQMISVYRYEDETLLNHMVETFMNQEETK